MSTPLPYWIGKLNNERGERGEDVQENSHRSDSNPGLSATRNKQIGMLFYALPVLQCMKIRPRSNDDTCMQCNDEGAVCILR